EGEQGGDGEGDGDGDGVGAGVAVTGAEGVGSGVTGALAGTVSAGMGDAGVAYSRSATAAPRAKAAVRTTQIKIFFLMLPPCRTVLSKDDYLPLRGEIILYFTHSARSCS
ncbi:MAG: hypothetical protein IJ617_03915, partial [Oscillospiraceae bacterium]|nr:hypothetical protein [Oscillospiraceae bacterium]